MGNRCNEENRVPLYVLISRNNVTINRERGGLNLYAFSLPPPRTRYVCNIHFPDAATTKPETLRWATESWLRTPAGQVQRVRRESPADQAGGRDGGVKEAAEEQREGDGEARAAAQAARGAWWGGLHQQVVRRDYRPRSRGEGVRSVRLAWRKGLLGRATPACRGRSGERSLWMK
eukprot:1189322-Prorocentrum_minimum.AAC.3